MRRVAGFTVAAGLALAQQAAPQPQDPAGPPTDAAQLPAQNAPSTAEQTDLMHAVNEGANSTADLVRVFEAFLKKYPDTNYRPDIEANLTRASIANGDNARIVKYGERVLERKKDDVVTLDKVAMALVALGGRENGEKSLTYARALDGIIMGLQEPEGADGPRLEDQRQQAQARELMTQAKAQVILGDNEESRRLAARAYSIYPGEETARVLSEALTRLGRNDEALEMLAEAFAIPDSRAAESDRLADRLKLGEWWKKSHDGSEKGLGDAILAAYDRTQTAVELREKKLLALDPNGAAKSASEFTITRVDGTKLQMASLQGKVLVLDFWATWCEPCRAEHPLYEETMQHYKGRDDVMFLPLSTDEDRSLVGPFIKDMKWDDNVYFDDGLQRVLGVSQIPTTIVLDKKGLVSSRMNGFVPTRFKEDLIDRIDAALGETSAH